MPLYLAPLRFLLYPHRERTVIVEGQKQNVLRAVEGLMLRSYLHSVFLKNCFCPHLFYFCISNYSGNET